MDKQSLLFIACISLSFLGIQYYFSSEKSPQKTKAVPVAVPSKPTGSLVVKNDKKVFDSSSESFYVLENEYQQLVFSNAGGSLVEVNLALRSKEHPQSIVKEIDIDRQILKQSPRNAHFPLMSYTTADGVFHQEGVLGGYYPLLRRSIFKNDGSFRSQLSPEYYSLAVWGDNPDAAKAFYKVTRFEPHLIEFQGSVNGQTVTKTYQFSSQPNRGNSPYCLDVTFTVEGSGSPLWLSSGVPDVELVSGSYSPLLRYQFFSSHETDVETISLPKKEGVQVSTISPNWISNNNGFLGLILDPLSPIAEGYRTSRIEGNVAPTRLSLIDPVYHQYPVENYPGYMTALPLQNDSTVTFRIFAGPFDEKLLKNLDEIYEDPSRDYNPSYVQAQSIQGWFSFISRPFSKFLFFLMQLFYAVTRSWAASILLLTLALRLMMYPLNAWSIKSSIKMQELAPKIKAVQERYKKDPKKAQMEVLHLYRESGINPLTGCLPVLLQMPFLIGMFYLLKSSFPLRGALFIPGWIDDLAAPDVLFSWGEPLWFIGNQFHLLPILMGATMYLQQKMTSKLPKDSSKLTDSQKQQKMMGNMMSILFTVMFYNFPSGLNIYFMFSTLLGIVQQLFTMKKMKGAIPVK